MKRIITLCIAWMFFIYVLMRNSVEISKLMYLALFAVGILTVYVLIKRVTNKQ